MTERDPMSEQAEWEHLLDEIPDDLPTSDAANRLGALLADAVQAQRPWARERLNEALHAGLGKAWKSHLNRKHPKVTTKTGSTVKSLAGVRRRSQGRTVWVQAPLGTCTRDELERYEHLHAQQLHAASANRAAVKRLRAIFDQAPNAATLAEACAAAGVELESVMAGAA